MYRANWKKTLLTEYDSVNQSVVFCASQFVRYRLLIGDRSFPAAAAYTWNSLPPSITASQYLQSFGKTLKTELFRMRPAVFRDSVSFCNMALKKLLQRIFNAAENAKTCGKNMRYAHFAKMCKMRQGARYAAIAYSRFSNTPNKRSIQTGAYQPPWLTITFRQMNINSALISEYLRTRIPVAQYPLLCTRSEDALKISYLSQTQYNQPASNINSMINRSHYVKSEFGISDLKLQMCSSEYHLL